MCEPNLNKVRKICKRLDCKVTNRFSGRNTGVTQPFTFDEGPPTSPEPPSRWGYGPGAAGVAVRCWGEEGVVHGERQGTMGVWRTHCHEIFNPLYKF